MQYTVTEYAMQQQISAVDRSTVSSYYGQIRNKPLLSRREEAGLSRQIKAGDEAARNALVEANLKLVVKIARIYRTADVSFADLIQEGNVGLVQAANRFDYRKNVRFSTYAALWIKQAINRYLNDKSRSITLPHRKSARLKQIKQAQELLRHELFREPTTGEVARFLGESNEAIERYLLFDFSTCSLESPDGDDSADVLSSWPDNSYTPEDELMQSVLRQETRNRLKKLLDIERKVLINRFALHGGKRTTLRELAGKLGLSPETVRLIEKRAMGKIRRESPDLGHYVVS